MEASMGDVVVRSTPGRRQEIEDAFQLSAVA
jgi:hypothetical protein